MGKLVARSVEIKPVEIKPAEKLVTLAETHETSVHGVEEGNDKSVELELVVADADIVIGDVSGGEVV